MTFPYNTQTSASSCIKYFLNRERLHSYQPAKFAKILLGDKNATYLCSKIVSTLPTRRIVHCAVVDLTLCLVFPYTIRISNSNVYWGLEFEDILMIINK